MRRSTVFIVVALLLVLPTLGSANPNGVGSGTFDAQCGGACHGDADMNRSSAATVEVDGPEVAYEGLLTSVSITVSNIETTTSGLLGIFLLSDLSGPAIRRTMRVGPSFPTAKEAPKTTSKLASLPGKPNTRWSGPSVRLRAVNTFSTAPSTTGRKTAGSPVLWRLRHAGQR